MDAPINKWFLILGSSIDAPRSTTTTTIGTTSKEYGQVPVAFGRDAADAVQVRLLGLWGS